MLLFFLICWLGFWANVLAGYPLAGTIRLNLFHLYGLAAGGGWLLGNLEVHRQRRFQHGSFRARGASGTSGARGEGDPLPRVTRRRLFFLNLLAPVGVLFLVWSLAPRPLRVAFPMASIYAAAILVLFFLVPVSLKRVFSPKWP